MEFEQTLPESGGLHDQPADWYDDIKVVLAAKREVEREHQDAEKQARLDEELQRMAEQGS